MYRLTWAPSRIARVLVAPARDKSAARAVESSLITQLKREGVALANAPGADETHTHFGYVHSSDDIQRK